MYFGAALIIIGLFLNYFGIKFLKVTIVLIITLSVMTFMIIVAFSVFSFINYQSTNAVWIVLAIGLAIGLGLSFFLIKAVKLVTMILGGYCGYIIGNVAYTTALNRIHASPEVIYWVSIVIFIIVFALLTLCIAKHALIIGCCVAGSYGIIRGASLYIGYFPNENIIMDLIKRGEFNQLEDVNILLINLFIFSC
jgi:hypothetical protein